MLNHSAVDGAEEEMDRLEEDMREHLTNGKDFIVGEVTLRWEPEELTLYYEGVIEHPFFQKEVDDAGMAVSLGIYYDSDSPTVCNQECYTIIRGAEFREVSLVYHPGFPIATIEAVEAKLKKLASEAIINDNWRNNANFNANGTADLDTVPSISALTTTFNFSGSNIPTLFTGNSSTAFIGNEAQLQPYFSIPKATEDQMEIPPNPEIMKPQDTMKEKEKAEEELKKKKKKRRKNS